MDGTRGLVVGVATVVVVTALVSGPLVPGVTLTESRQVTYGEGNATVASIDFPDRATIERGGFGSGSNYLVIPPATVQFETLEGGPILSYGIEIPALNYSRSTTHFLTPDIGDSYEAALESDSLRSEPDADRYNATLGMWIEDSGGRERIAGRNITVEVVS